MSACPTLTTPRLVLRPFVDADLDGYLEMLNAPDVRHSLRLGERVTRNEAWLGMAQWRGQWELRGSGQWAVCDRVTGTFLGRAGLHRPEVADWPGLEVGWTLHPDQWGHGYATEAGARAIAYGFEVLEVEELVSVILPDNLRSQSVARRLGLSFAGERILSTYLREPHGIWRLRREDWSTRA
jgi:RimJ/RimL family protein N-acetyltransferase